MEGGFVMRGVESMVFNFVKAAISEDCRVGEGWE